MIKTNVHFTDHSIAFKAKTAIFADTMIALMATAIEAKIKTAGEVPFLPKSTKYAQRGALRTSVRSRKIALGRYVVTVGENSPAGAYAAAQEAGQARGHVFKNYSTPGTGPHFMQHAIDTIKERGSQYAQTAKDAAGLGSNL
jgi:hypothetical protein